MPTTTPFITHITAGGWATDFGTVVHLAPRSPENLIAFPFLLEAKNVFFENNVEMLQLIGPVSNFAIAGEELLIDDLRFERDGGRWPRGGVGLRPHR